MNTETLRKIYGTLSRLENFLESFDRYQGDETEMLLCEIDESEMFIREELYMKRAEEMAREAGSADWTDFYNLAKDELEEVLL